MSARLEHALMIAIVVAFFAFCACAVVWSCDKQSECIHAKCSTPGLTPVWTHRDAQCVCAEVPQ